ncbi:SpvB/TcaC N-terminal domain-containing protein [Pseudoalteromonas luteoviolacea]|uniref:SpvB/TcaC N-terminal domain-containing protein n=1 Tax=Pseudoalteromonas luteoviolacea TaxID=43657 RepID=UPI00114F54B6|nr:SpvB/TcaC N-terminal domain-containing protein [Pseudoalteromonas luteoviolacea]TQF70187.1 PQQ-binding-like beta-propeller repeat protein [Pseudoalteromonas luteoviolacea]
MRAMLTGLLMSLSSLNAQAVCENTALNVLVNDSTPVKILKGPRIYTGLDDQQDEVYIKIKRDNTTLYNSGLLTETQSYVVTYSFPEVGVYNAELKATSRGFEDNGYGPIQKTQYTDCTRTVNVMPLTVPAVTNRSHVGNANVHPIGAPLTGSFTVKDEGKDLTELSLYVNRHKVSSCSLTPVGTNYTCRYTIGSNDLEIDTPYLFAIYAKDSFGKEAKASFTVTAREQNTAPSMTLKVGDTTGSSTQSTPHFAEVGSSVSIVMTATDNDTSAHNSLSGMLLSLGQELKPVRAYFGTEVDYNNACSIEANTATCTLSHRINASTQISAQAIDNQNSTSDIHSVEVNAVSPSVPNIRRLNSDVAPFVGDTITLEATIDEVADLEAYYLCQYSVADVNANTGCATPIKHCSLTARVCTHEVAYSTLDGAQSQTFTVYAKKRGVRGKGNQTNVTYRQFYGIHFELPPPNVGSNQHKYHVGEDISFEVSLSALNIASTSLTSLTLYEGGPVTGHEVPGLHVPGMQTPTDVIPLPHPSQPPKVIRITWKATAQYVGQNKTFTFVATDNTGQTVSASLTGVQIAHSTPDTPVIGALSITPDAHTQGQYVVNIAGLSNTKQLSYQAIVVADGLAPETVKSALIENFTGTEDTFTVNTQLAHHGKKLKVTVTATNYGSAGEPTHTTREFTMAQPIANLEMAPHTPEFDNPPTQAGGPYTLTWHANTDGVTSQYKLQYWAGLPSDKTGTTPTNVSLATELSTEYTVTAPLFGRYTYQITACNSQAQCVEGQQVTVEHIAPYFSSGSIQSCSAEGIKELDEGRANNTVPASQVFTYGLHAEGIGFNPGTSTLYVRIRKTGQSSTVEATTTDRSLQATVSEDICRGYVNGGLALTIKNGVKRGDALLRNTLVIDKTGTDYRPDLTQYEYTVSDNLYLYSGTEQGLKAQRFSPDGLPHFVWESRLEASESSEVVAKPLVESVGATDHIYVGSLNHRFYKVTHDPRQAEPNQRVLTDWVLKTRGPIHAQAALDQDHNLYVGSMDESLYSVDPSSGNVQWQYVFPGSGGVMSQPAVSGSGHIYVTTEDGEVSVIDKRLIEEKALKWAQVDALFLRFEDKIAQWERAQWQADQSHVELFGLARAVYVLLQRAPSKNELSLLGYLLFEGVPYNELIHALINANPALAEATDSSFIDTFFHYLLGSASPDISLHGGELGSGNTTYWVAQLASGVTRADVVMALLGAARNQYDDAVNNLLYHQFGFCLASQTCVYDFDTDGDGLSDRAEAQLNTNPIDPNDGLVAPTIALIDHGNGEVSIEVSTTGLVHTYQLFEAHLPESYKLGEVFQADIHAQESLTTVHKQLGNGIYYFKAKTCVNVSSQYNEQHVQCSNDDSNEVRLEVNSSATEWPISVNLPNTQASKKALDSTALLEHASLQPTVGDFRVTESGTASYHIPIAVPAGITGVKPSVSLSYNSQAPDGPVALGWNLNAVSGISRCRQTKAQDGQFKGLTFTEADRYCLDGQRLISKDPQTHDGDFNGATILDEYVTEIDSQQTIYRVTKNDDIWFVIKGKDGSTKHYGTSDLSRVVIHEQRDNVATLSWMISKVEDNVGHPDTAIHYTYTDKIDSVQLKYGERLLSAIHYSGNRVEFGYSLGDIRSRAFIAKDRLEQRARLTRIEVKNHTGQVLSTYALSFESVDNGLRLLKQVQQCRTDVCRKPIKFEYNTFATGLTFDARSQVVDSEVAALTMADLHGDGKPELITLVRKDAEQKRYELCVFGGATFQQPDKLGCKSITRQDDHESVVMLTTDPDQDGKHTIVVNMRADHTTEFGVKYWDEFALSSDNQLVQKNSNLFWPANQYMREVKQADINGDGYADLIYKRKKDDVNLYTQVWDVQRGFFGVETTLRTTNPDQGFDSRGDFTEKATDWQVVDLNFDGLADIIALQCDTDDTCADDEAKRIAVHYNQGGSHYHKFSAHYVASASKIEHLMPADVNGDGLVDIIYLGKDPYGSSIKRWEVLLNRSSSEEAFTRGLSIQAYNEEHQTGTVSADIPPLLADLDKNGRTEIYFKSGTSSDWIKYEWTPKNLGSGEGNEHFKEVSENVFTEHLDHEKGHYAFFADYNHDGVPDLLTKDKQGVHVRYNLGQSATEGLLKEITQGYNNKTTIAYGLMTNKAIYGDLEDDLSEDAATFERDGLKVTHMIGAMPLVHTVETDSPSTHNEAARAKVTYYYEGARAQFGGRGVLGFKALTTQTTKQGSDDPVGTVFTTTTRYHQAFPLTGMPYSTVKKMGDDVVLSQARNTYLVTPVAQKGSTQSYRVHNKLSRECSALVNTDFTVDLYRCTQTDVAQDTFANVTQLKVDSYQIANIDRVNFMHSGTIALASKSVLTTNEYGSTDEYQRYGRLTRTMVTTQVPNRQSITRSSDFTYYEGTQFDLMLFEEVVGKGLGCKYELTKTHHYDHFGNQVKVDSQNTGCLADERETRTTTSFFSEDGRYVNYTEQSSTKEGALKIRGVQSTSTDRNAFGAPTLSTDVHGVVSETQFDAFGGVVGQYTSTGAQSLTYYASCDDGAMCAAQRNKEVNGELVEVQYIDRLGRVYRTSHRDVTGQWLSSTTVYDEYGRAVEVIAPGAQSVTTHYDVLDRVIQIYDANNETTTTSVVSGLSSTTQISGTGIADQTKVSTSNILGEVLSATENNGQAVEFTYYADGSKDTVRSKAESTSNQLVMRFTYDALGRKHTQIDADRGDWSYTYNAFGELLTQTDARGVVLTHTYDGFGRKTKQVQTTPDAHIINEGASEWHYGQTSDTAHLLLRTQQGADWQQHYYYDTFGRSAAVLTALERTHNCDTQVVFNTLSNDLRIVQSETDAAPAALLDPLVSKCVIQQTAYDAYGRVSHQFDDYRRLNGAGSQYVEARGVAIEYAFGQVLAKTEARDGREGQTYYRIVNTNERGQVTEYLKGGVTMQVGYDTQGMLSAIYTKSHGYIQADSYRFDSLGNLISRAQIGMRERTYHYDSLNRVLGVNNVDLFTYSSTGNLEEKADYRILEAGACNGTNVEITNKWSQVYGEDNNPLHALTSRTRLSVPACETTSATAANHHVDQEIFTYDENGNETMVTDGTHTVRSIKYSGRNKAIEITAKGDTVTFSYDVNNRRYKREEAGQTIYYVGALQLTLPNDESKDKVINRNIGNDAQQTYFSTGLSKTKWMFTDHQGSIIAITNSEYKLLKRYSYDIFGKQSAVVETQADIDAHYAHLATLTVLDSISSNFKAYTGHEPVALGGEKRIIHMNGRIFDADTGRFMQADPFVQAPTNLQNYNAYSYVLNNPLSYTDPSGYLFKKVHDFSKKIRRQVIRGASKVFGAQVVSIVGNILTVFCGPAQAACAAAWNYEFTRAMGGSVSQALKAGLTAAVTAGAGQSIGFQSYSAQFVFDGVVGGIMADVNGGNFGHAFWAAGLNTLLGGGGNYTQNPITNVVISAAVGGTISEVTGGKFRNGAYSAAFTSAMRQDWGAISGKSYSSAKGKVDFSTEGTAEERKQRFLEIKSGEKRVYFEDVYLGVESKGGVISTHEFTDAELFQSWLKNSPAGTKRGWRDGIHHDYIITDKIILYRTAVMGLKGTRYLPDGGFMTRDFSPIEQGHIILGHELGHRFGLEMGVKYRSKPHVLSNRVGINRCKFFGYCGEVN